MSISAPASLSTDSWHLCSGAGKSPDGIISTPPGPFDDALYSPLFQAEPDTVIYATFTLELVEGGVYVFAVRKGQPKYLVARSLTDPGKPTTVTLRLNPPKRGWYQFALGNFRTEGGTSKVRVLGFTLETRSLQSAKALEDTCLPHWGFFKRWLHRRCKASRNLNTFVSAIEMRLGREELLSLPQFMAICPTGICNALCSFCSVTQNRGGIAKQELKPEDLTRITGPAMRTVRTFGLEGNGEPTIHKRFDAIVDRLGRHGADQYLITNGEKLTPELIDRMIADGVKTVNVSLNAATAATHHAVMKLKGWDQVIANLRYLVRSRTKNWPPRISLSMVVTQLNIHEVVDFIRFAEQDLGVDAVHVRPLSELGDDLGAVEDVRAIVPYEGDVADMQDAVAEYLADHPRTTEVHFVPTNFRSVQPDPADRLLMPQGFAGRLLPPRRHDWVIASETQVTWSATGFALKSARAGEAAVSGLVPGDAPNSPLLRFRYRLSGKSMVLVIRDDQGQELLRRQLPASAEAGEIALHLPVAEGYRIVLLTTGVCTADFDFERLRTPARGPARGFRLPPPDRWRTESAHARVAWQGSALSLAATGTPGPYLVKSYACAVRPGRLLAIGAAVTVRSGKLGIGVLDQGGQTWLTTWQFTNGQNQEPLRLATGRNRSLALVLFSASDAPLDASVTWDAIDDTPDPSALPEEELKHPGAPAAAAAAKPSKPKDEWDLEEEKQRPAPILTQSISRPRQIKPFFCQKPWTDLNSFTVDGRADVCCIATGPSQKRFALGNLIEQEFQEVWNGERAREFRRTVNSAEKLPPCQRCPMAQAWEGPLFSRERTHAVLGEWLEKQIRWSFVRRPVRRVLSWFVNRTVFRGF
ncbi:MAG: radical SAM/SPASM domain-containing protein [Planctomycetota bacterium]